LVAGLRGGSSEQLDDERLSSLESAWQQIGKVHHNSHGGVSSSYTTFTPSPFVYDVPLGARSGLRSRHIHGPVEELTELPARKEPALIKG
jgi:hypothetical protein